MLNIKVILKQEMAYDWIYKNLDIADKYGFISVVDGEPVRHISWDPRNRPDYVIIGHNCILSKHKGKGYGKMQLLGAIKRIKEYGIKKIIVSTNEILISAQKKYESVGFVRVGTRKNIDATFSGKEIDYELFL